MLVSAKALAAMTLAPVELAIIDRAEPVERTHVRRRLRAAPGSFCLKETDKTQHLVRLHLGQRPRLFKNLSRCYS